MTFFKNMLRDEAGATAIEYGLIAVAAITALSNVGSELNTTFTAVGGSLETANSVIGGE